MRKTIFGARRGQEKDREVKMQTETPEKDTLPERQALLKRKIFSNEKSRSLISLSLSLVPVLSLVICLSLSFPVCLQRKYRRTKTQDKQLEKERSRMGLTLFIWEGVASLVAVCVVVWYKAKTC
jgi:hypothetical protein